jgi:hypothetical protein
MIFNVVWRPQTRSYVDGSKAVEVLQGSMDSGGVGTRRWLFPEVGDLGGEGKLEERLVVQRWKDEGLNLEQRVSEFEFEVGEVLIVGLAGREPCRASFGEGMEFRSLSLDLLGLARPRLW